MNSIEPDKALKQVELMRWVLIVLTHLECTPRDQEVMGLNPDVTHLLSSVPLNRSTISDFL